ncbi:kinase-like domain-containing protein [Aspergillus avenaceus]|uniref:Kinase-like domain-containing protein n=1 Tax=Aspergillus avenaceus TaxID=36643 RepID=A0A5N6TXS0_ASPAV|nr:kinase-like domain-containing protein [Aspergillus avenaceus]
MGSSLTNDPERVARIMLSWHSLELVSCKVLQTLWAGYGHICAISARATTKEARDHLSELCRIGVNSEWNTYPLILKLIAPPRTDGENEGHLRKLLSYEVEQRFYTDVVPLLSDETAVAKCLASTRDVHDEELGGLMATIMIDLRPKYPVTTGKRGMLNRRQVYAALDWLAVFHSCSWSLLPDSLDGYVLPPLEEARRRESEHGGGSGLWLNGGYTYLATRRSEYASLAEDTDSEWCEALCTAPEGSELSVAEMVALFLTPCGRPFETYIHGDVKSENFFMTANGDDVAFFDFQYVGLGLGVCDLAKLFTCSVPVFILTDENEPLPEQLTMCDGERKLLEQYRARLLQDEEPERYDWEIFKRHWETALVDWCRFQASWGFWGNTEWLEARVRSILSDQGWRDWLYQSIGRRIGSEQL